MSTTFITFGRRYGLPGNCWGLEPHPSGYPVSGDGWCEIIGCDREQARKLAFQMFDDHWAFDYDENNFDPAVYPAGCQLRLTIETPSKTPEIFDEAWTIAPWNKSLPADAIRKLGDLLREEMLEEHLNQRIVADLVRLMGSSTQYQLALIFNPALAHKEITVA